MRHTTKVFSFIGAFVILLALAGFFLLTSPQRQLSTATVQNVPYKVEVQTQPTRLSAGRPATVLIHVAHAGRPFEVEATGRLLHVMIVSANVRDTFHTFTPTPEGKWGYRVEHIFTQPGKYRIWTEVDNATSAHRHDQNAEHIAYADVTVAGEASPTSSLVESDETLIGPYRLKLLTSQLQAREQATLRIEARDSAGKLLPLYAEEPFLYFISGENFSFFRHGHGVTLPDGSAGLENVFPVAGRYVFWLQLHLVEDDIIHEVQVPFLVTVN